MKIFVYSKQENIAAISEKIYQHDWDILYVSSAQKLYQHEEEKCVLLVDLDVVRQEGFTIATKVAGNSQRKAIIIGVTSLDVDPRGSKFDFFFNDFSELATRFEEIAERYEAI